ncbi:LytR/AlgR family response regulator transcription factor [Spirosoma arcticum]
MKNKYRTLIVEDDPLIVAQLEGFLAQTDLFEKPYIAQTCTQAMISLHDQPIDLLFLDMELPDMSGLDFLRLFPGHGPTIAISAFPSYAVDCYDCDINDFLSKPFTYTRFLRGLRRTLLQSLTPVPAVSPVPETSFSPAPGAEASLEPKPSALLPDHIYLKTGRTNSRFALTDILYFEAYTIYSKLVTGSDTFVINDQISSLGVELGQNQFIRVHKSYLINLNHVTKFNARTIWVKTHAVPVGRTFKKQVQDHLNSFVSG